MTGDANFRFSNLVVWVPLGVLISIWAVYWSEIAFGLNYNSYGIYPRSLIGLRGLVLSPFIHGSLSHLYHNTIPLGILLAALFYFYSDVAWSVLFYGILGSGFITWCIGRESYHIGASGLIYVLVSFIFFKGILSKHFRLIALSLVVVFIYGSMLWYIFPVKDGISWEGHLGGFLTGLILAFFIASSIPTPKKYAWEREDYREDEDPFLKHFDEDGNFVETLPETSEKEHLDTSSSTYVYHVKKETENLN